MLDTAIAIFAQWQSQSKNSQKIMFPKISYLIYDMDGLLLDTESIHEQVNQEIAKRYDRTYDKLLKLKVAGRTTLESAKIIVDYLELPLNAEEYIIQRNEIIYQLYPDSQPLPGAVHLTQHFKNAKIPQAIATSSSRRHFELKTINHQQWLESFDLFVFGDDPEIAEGKPAPYIFLLAAQRLGAKPEECLVFEDSIAGMQAAIAAGMSVVVIPDRDLDHSFFEDSHQILNSLTEFQPQLWSLPKFF
jgi:HAD superfamily hydrolase (TIGR01509 family)